MPIKFEFFICLKLYGLKKNENDDDDDKMHQRKTTKIKTEKKLKL